MIARAPSHALDYLASIPLCLTFICVPCYFMAVQALDEQTIDSAGIMSLVLREKPFMGVVYLWLPGFAGCHPNRAPWLPPFMLYTGHFKCQAADDLNQTSQGVHK